MFKFLKGFMNSVKDTSLLDRNSISIYDIRHPDFKGYEMAESFEEWDTEIDVDEELAEKREESIC